MCEMIIRMVEKVRGGAQEEDSEEGGYEYKGR